MFRSHGNNSGKAILFTGLVFCFYGLFTNLASAAQPPLAGQITPYFGSSVPGKTVTFSASYVDADGWQDIQEAYFLVNTFVKFSDCVYLYYDRKANKLYLRNDTGATWLGGLAPGAKKKIENSYVRLDCSKTTVSASGSILTVNWCLIFNAAFAHSSVKNLYLSVRDASGLSSPWVQKGTWLVGVNKEPAAVAIDPADGSSVAGQEVNFSTTYIDPNTWQDIQDAGFLVSTGTSMKNSFAAYYRQNQNRLYLRDDTDTKWLGGFLPGSDNIIENSFVQLDCANTSVSGESKALTVNWSVVFKESFVSAEPRLMSILAKDDSNKSSGWVKKGKWQVLMAQLPVSTLPRKSSGLMK